MLIKSADDRSKDILQLNALLGESTLTSRQRTEIQKQLDDLEKGAWGEQQAAYYLDFHFAGSKNLIVLHDLRLVLSDGRTAQIDHLLINRCLDIYVLESKNWHQLTVDKTGACTTWAGRVIGVESPLEQCRRHAEVVLATFRGHPELKELAPRQNIIPKVLVAPRCNLRAPHHQEWYLKADSFYTARQKEIDNESFYQSIASISRLKSTESLWKIGQTLAELHHLTNTDWRARFGLTSPPKRAYLPALDLISRIEGLKEYVPKWGEDWFVLHGTPTQETKKAIKAAGYRAQKEKGEWIWRLKAAE
jgi:hypothetical protein